MLNDTIVNNCLCWIFDHCCDLEDYKQALIYIGLSQEEIEQELTEVGYYD